jgi:hypothetical protein
MVTVDEIQTAATKPPGTLEFRLENFGYLGADFSAERYQGQRVLVKGTLVRQQSAERINITSLTTVAETCSQ